MSVNGFYVSIAGEIPSVFSQTLLLFKCTSECVWHALGGVVGFSI